MMLIIGCGYLGRRLARRLLAQGERVTGVVRSAQSARQLESLGIRPVRADLATGDLSVLPLQGSRLFHFAPPPGEGVEDPGTRRLVKVFDQAGNPRRVVYISTSGVYGDCGGAWVDERRAARPETERARRRLDAERALRQWHRNTGGGLVVLRVAGIYGPGKLPIERIRRGLPLVRSGEAPFTNRIHADDLVTLCALAMECGGDGAVYNACDGQPGTMADYFDRVADAAGLPRPPKIPLAEAERRLSPGMLSYMRESRRLSNRRIREELGMKLRYPTLEEGLAACFGADASARPRPR